MSLAVIVPYQLLTPPSPPPPTPILGVTSLEPIKIDFELLEDILLFGDLTKGPKPSKIHVKFTKNINNLLYSLILIILIFKALCYDEVSNTNSMATGMTSSGGKITT